MQTEPNVKIDQPEAAAEDFEVIQADPKQEIWRRLKKDKNMLWPGVASWL